MPVEPREAGRWKRERQNEGTTTLGSAGNGSTRGRHPSPVGMEPAVWTERMLATLETGIEGGKWFRLIDKVWSPKNLAGSLQKVVAKGGSAGIDNQSARAVGEHQEQTIQKLEQELRAGQYQPRAVKRVWIPKPGSQEKRPLGVPTVRDRIVQGAVLQVIEPIFEREFAAQSYGFRPGRGCKDALRRVEELLRSGKHWVVDADLKSYFDTIPHGRLMERVGEKIADGKVLSLIEGMLQAGVMDSVEGWQATKQGSPQGAVISPLLSNIYLNGLDWKMTRNGFEWSDTPTISSSCVLARKKHKRHWNRSANG